MKWPVALAGRVAAAATALALLARNLHAAISVGPTGLAPLTFSTTPPAVDIAIGVLVGTATTFTDVTTMDAGVQGLDQSIVSRELPTSGTTPPSTFSGGFRRNTTLNSIQSRPTTEATNAANVLVVRLVNDSGLNRAAAVLSYDFAVQTPLAGELPGFNVYFSLTGVPGGWQPIPELTGSEVAGNVSGTLNLGSWPVGAPLYLLWADDNADAITDPSYTIDNLQLVFQVDPPVIVQEPVGATNVISRTVSLSVTATGIGLQYQWHKVGVGPINPLDNPAAATSTLVITNAAVSDSGDYFVVVSNQGGGRTSQTVPILINLDSAPPQLLSARILPSPGNNTFLLVVDEPLCVDPDPTTGCGSDANFQFNWEIQDAETGADLGGGHDCDSGNQRDFHHVGISRVG